ncbi:AAA domain-containing protein [Erwinia sp. STN24]|uniref:AAA domain-containing protein n=1 Tax=Erwinia sp. STN24 TaxID=3233996 RepID=UPI003521CEAD
MNNTSNLILTAWQDYVQHSGAEKSKIPASKVHEYQQLFITRQHCRDEESGVRLTIPAEMAESWRRRFVKYDDKGYISHIEPISFLFPIIRCVDAENGNANAKYLPLFSFPVPKSFFTSQDNTLLIPVNDGQQVSAFPFAFRNTFSIELAELGENRHMMSIVSALTGHKYEGFYAAFEGLLQWISQQRQTPETAFNALIAPLHNEDFTTQRDGKDYQWLCDKPEGTFPLLEQYLTYEHSANEAPACFDLPTHGLFEQKYPLGHGQMQAIQAINQEERLIAVQGAPGTGKTTLFKSLIAQKLVERALAIADGQDRNCGMLVTSTAIKAVENIIDDLRKDPVTQNLDWLWFQGGSNKQIQQEFSRLERLIDRWRQGSYEPERQQAFLESLNQHRQQINACYQEYINHKACTLQSISDCGFPTTDITEVKAALATKVANFFVKAANFPPLLVTQSDDLFSLDLAIELQKEAFIEAKRRRKQAWQLAMEIESTWPLPHNWQSIVAWLDDPLRPVLEKNYHDYPRQGIRHLLARVLTGKYQTRCDKMRARYADSYQRMMLIEFSHQQLVELADAGANLSADKEAVQLLKLLLTPEPDPEELITLDALEKEIAELMTLQRRVELAQHYIDEHAQRYPEGSWCDILRKRFIRQHREMFADATGYLWQEQLKRKHDLEEVVTHWRALISRQKTGAGYYRWLERLDDFYSALSLVYPIMATTLVSAYKMAGYAKLSELKGHKPWALALCDEAGMISAESLVPLLSRSEKAMIVGDPLQIEPIRTLSEGTQQLLRQRHFATNNLLYERVSPATVTAYHRAAGSATGRAGDIGNGIILDEHRRCQLPIARLFTRVAGYQGVTVETAPPDKRIAQAFEKAGGHHLMFYSVEGQKGRVANTNLDEAEAIGQLLDKLEDAGYDLCADVGIVTPYSNQKSLLVQRFAKRMNHWEKNCIGTVHQFQGVGFEVIIYSPVIFHPLDKEGFQNDAPNMLNVVVSRARQQFIVVGNYRRLKQAGGYLAIVAQTLADDFLLEQGSQHPDFERISQTPRLQRYYKDCEHIAAFAAKAATCEQELLVVTPWIRRGGLWQRPELAMLVAAQRRGITVKVCYGYHHQRLDRGEDNDNDLVAEYCDQLGKENVIRLPEGTHEKLLVVDGRYITLGSWNWLSHGYHHSCEGSGNFSNAIRHELSAELDDVSFVNELKERLSF